MRSLITPKLSYKTLIMTQILHIDPPCDGSFPKCLLRGHLIAMGCFTLGFVDAKSPPLEFKANKM